MKAKIDLIWGLKFLLLCAMKFFKQEISSKLNFLFTKFLKVMFNVQILNTVSDCDTILAEAGKIKTSLEIKVESLTRQMNGYNAESATLPAQLVAKQEELVSLTEQLQTDLSPITRREVQRLKNKAEIRIRALIEEIASVGPVGFLIKSKQLDYFQEILNW
ncbi:MAG: hypothetical protein IPP69_16120 [Flavobacteriales bacterium]|nr:hypothetical protein [Flavobacteriales bacterium]